MLAPASYHQWYQSPRGAWFAERELALLRQLMQPQAGESLLDLGCGTGFFSSGFADLGLEVSGLDPDPAMLDFARQRDPRVRWLQGRGESLPFADGAFDQVLAMTSLCFVADPQQALAEMWRVSGKGVTLGLLNRHSLLYRQKRASPGYAAARWDSLSQALGWVDGLSPRPRVDWASGIFLPSATPLARGLERLLPSSLAWGGVLVLCLQTT
ncbi:methyltransferase domain-containing protein [Magnetovirga frankeli]|uniref:class I SAM-dependent methyltransferase n=1 Tax=Magnetovirga frankeli TaxID=947516 RepID=UPI001293D785|nr:methyltransferase domain-containing protein [gamma proteobacterium SS-5]